jgi:hypothetical protein
LTGGIDFFDGASVARYLDEILAGNAGAVTLVTNQEFHGAPALVLVTEGKGDNLTAFFDPQTYTLRGFREFGTEMWLETEEFVAEADVPADAFSFDLPPGVVVKEIVYP